jgi:membrane fusion protein (multidrug efflux system)
MGKKRWGLVILRYLILLILVAGAVFYISKFVGKRGKVTYEAPLPLIETGQVTYGDIARTIVLSSHVEADTMIPVVPLVSGTVMEFPVKVGQKVKEGDIIAKIDDEPFRQQLLQAEASYLAYANTFKRVESLYQSKNTTVQNYDQAKAQRDAAKAQFDLAQLQVGYATVRAKASGTILTTSSAKGSTAAQGSSLAVIADLGNLVVNLKVPEKNYDIFLKKQGTIKVTVSRPDGSSSCLAEVLSIDPYIQAQSKVFGVKCKLIGDVSGLRPGMYVKATVEYDQRKSVPLLPQKIRKADGSCYLYDAETSTVKYVELSPELESETVFVVPDAYKDAVFVFDGQGTVFDGQSVRVKQGE